MPRLPSLTSRAGSSGPNSRRCPAGGRPGSEKLGGVFAGQGGVPVFCGGRLKCRKQPVNAAVPRTEARVIQLRKRRRFMARLRRCLARYIAAFGTASQCSSFPRRLTVNDKQLTNSGFFFTETAVGH